MRKKFKDIQRYPQLGALRARLEGLLGPDGLAVDSQGRVIVANPGLGFAWVLNHRAEPVLVLRSPLGASLTNVAFGGPDRKTLYCTESVSGSILRSTLDVPGLPLARLHPTA